MPLLPKIIVILGPTASGKTGLSLDLAKKFNGEIVNADSRQVYKEMDIATAKPMPDELARVRHHLISVVNPDDEFTLAHYKKEAFEAIDDILSRNKLPIIVGGTGLYIWAIIDNLDIPAVSPDKNLRAKLEAMDISELAEMLKKADPDSAEKVDLKNKRRVIRAIEVAFSQDGLSIAKPKKFPPCYDVLQLGLRIDRDKLYQRINKRVDAQIGAGLVEETKKLAQKYSWELPSMSGIGYKQLGHFLRGEIGEQEAIEMIKRDTRHYAKRQMTWFKRDKRIEWVDDAKEAEDLVRHFVKNF